MRYEQKRLIDFNPLIESKRIFSQQKALNYIRIFIVYLGVTIYLLLKPVVHPWLVMVLIILIAYCTILAVSRRLQLLFFRKRITSSIIDTVLIFFLCYYSGGVESPCLMAFMLPVLVCAIEPYFIRLLLSICMSLGAMILLGLLTGLDTVILVDGVYIVFAGLLVNVLINSDFRILSNYAVRDGLTSLYTHQYFYDKLNSILEECPDDSGVNLVMIDLDDFKLVNDEHGHLHGDRVLRKVADTIRANVRDTDVVARYGGDEFAIILPGVDPDLCKSIIERLREAIINLGYFTHVSLGCARYPDEAAEIYQLVDLADQRMYAEKRLKPAAVTESPVFNERRILH